MTTHADAAHHTMFASVPVPPSGPEVLDAASELRSTIAARAAEIEQARRVPADLVETLKTSGCLRVLMPRSHGGVEADLPTALRVFDLLARADASVGWTTMIGATGWVDLAALPADAFEEIFGRNGDRVLAGTFSPTGRITPVDGGYRVTGRWSHASGCGHADWLWGNCVESVTDGVPALRVVVFPAGAARIEDTWYVSGLSGTGSHHFTVQDLFVPRDHTLIPLRDPARLDLPVTRMNIPGLIALSIAAVALGIAHGALEDIAAQAQSKVPLLAADRLAGNPLFQNAFAAAHAELRAADLLLHECATQAWQRAVAGVESSTEEHAGRRAAAVWVTERACAVVDMAYRFGGGTALFADNPLQRRLRDVHAVTQHFLVKADTLTAAGSALLGQGVPVPVF